MHPSLTTGNRQSVRGAWPGPSQTVSLKLTYCTAQDYDNFAEDLENGAIEIRHPELMPQRRR
jgi:hypothetical protein